MTFNTPEENTLGAIVGNARRRVSNTARRIGRASAHRGTLGTAFLGLGATIVVGLRAVYGVSWFAGLWSSYPQPFLGLIAWLVLGVTIIGTIAASRAVGDLLPDWMFALFLAGIAASIALDVIAVWDLHDIGRNATAGLAAGMTLLLLVTRRGRIEVLIAAGVVGVWLAVLMFLDAPSDVPVDADWIAPQVTGLALAVLPPVIGVVIVETFRRLVQVELDRVLVQSTVSAPRFAVGMLASEELARLDLAAVRALGNRLRLDHDPVIASRRLHANRLRLQSRAATPIGVSVAIVPVITLSRVANQWPISSRMAWRMSAGTSSASP